MESEHMFDPLTYRYNAESEILQNKHATPGGSARMAM